MNTRENKKKTKLIFKNIIKTDNFKDLNLVICT